MNARPSLSLPLLLALFVVSGFSALIYQSIWTHYLGLLLGHAAHAQTLVLVMFMGGMALGAWGVSRRTQSLRRLIGLYAAVEAVIGLLGFGFHPAFVAVERLGQMQVLPALPSELAAQLWQWGSAALLIAPQTVLLGATFPLIAAGLMRLAGPGASGRSLGGLYFTNSIGAALGALAATFLLLPALGMRGALAVAAGLNLLLAAATAWISLREEPRPAPQPAPVARAAGAAPVRPLTRLLLAATFLSSAASFAYEIGWVRLLNQALGTTLHGFELMLAAFIAGLAFGGLWVRHRADRVEDLVRYAGGVQLLMGAAALLSVPVLAGSFHWVGWLHGALSPSNAGYALYMGATALIAIAVMLPAAFCAGMTLPLFTQALLRAGAGERAIGQIYAANTLGAILGVVLVVHLLIPALGVALSLLLAGLMDSAVGLWLWRRGSPGRWTRGGLLAGAGSLLLAAGVLRLGLPDPLLQSAGVFRTGLMADTRDELLFFRDGETATVSVRRHGSGIVSIATNGKPDAAMTPLQLPPTSDEITMLMLGLMPLAAHPAPRQVGVIGWGSGLSTHTLLGDPRVHQVETLEIEPAMWEGAKAFLPRNARAYDDARSVVRFEDARRVLAGARERYDVIVSEPSNPWVSGVASLFTQEFYALVHRRLKDDGLLVQWIHSYEMSDALLAEMLAALLTAFPEVDVYISNTHDLILLGHKGARRPLNALAWQPPQLAGELRRVGLASLADVQVRHLGGSALLRTLVRQHGVAPHSDFWPTVALAAPQQRFARRQATQLAGLLAGGVPVLEALACRQPLPTAQAVEAGPPGYLLSHGRETARAAAAFVQGQTEALWRLNPGLATRLLALRAGSPGTNAQGQTAALARATLPWLDPVAQQALWAQLGEPRLAALYRGLGTQDWRAARIAAEALLAPDAGLLPELRAEVWLQGQLAMAREQGAAAALAWQPASAPPATALGGQVGFVRSWLQHEAVCRAPLPKMPA